MKEWHVEYREPCSGMTYGFFVYADDPEEVLSRLSLDVKEVVECHGEPRQHRVRSWADPDNIGEDLPRLLHHACFVAGMVMRYRGNFDFELLLSDGGIIHEIAHMIAGVETSGVDVVSRISDLEAEVAWMWPPEQREW